MRIALAENGVEHENVPAPPHSSELADHPPGKVPLLRHGGVTVAEPFGHTDAYLVPILFYIRWTPEGGPMLAARLALTRYFDTQLQRSSVQATQPALPE